jgi:molybdopterin-guanine dinucleotide biosynthesis protein A
VTTPAFDAVVLAGGRGSRLGGADKAVIALRGERLVDRAVASARVSGAGRIVVVGPEHTGSEGVLVVREEPPFAGPLAALAAALPHLRADWLLLLSCDLVHPDAVCALLLEQLSRFENENESLDGVVLQDEDGRDQWLAGAYRLAALRGGLRATGADLENAPLRALLGGLRLQRIDAPRGTTADIDEPADLERAVGAAAAPPVEGSAERGIETRAPGVSTRFARSTGGDVVPPVERSAQHGVGTRPADTLAALQPPERTKETPMITPKHLPPEALDQWLAAAAAELGLDPEAVSIATVLDVARDVAHDVARPAAPLSTFLLGLAVGRSGDPETLQALAVRITARAAEWKAAAGGADSAG